MTMDRSLSSGERAGIFLGNLCITPLLGLILYLVWKDQSPTKAKQTCNLTLISLAVWIVVYGALFALGVLGSILGAGTS